MYTDTRGNTHRQKCRAKGSRREYKIQESMYRDTTNVEHEMYDYTGNNWSHRNGKKSFKEKFGSHTRKKKTFNTRKVTTKDGCCRNVTQNVGSTAFRNLNPER